MNYKKKYLKYKLKYLNAKKLYGGMNDDSINDDSMEEDNSVEPGDLRHNQTRPSSRAADVDVLTSIMARLSIHSPQFLMELVTPEREKNDKKRDRTCEEEVSKEPNNKKRDISKNDKPPNELRRGPDNTPRDLSPEPSIDVLSDMDEN